MLKFISLTSQQETLPKVSSKNFKQKEIGKPIIDCTLFPGDILYFPRGYIHQVDTNINKF